MLPWLHGQDIHFSAFFAAPLVTNPANTGFFEGNWRIAGIYRNQWRNISSPLNSAGLSYDRKADLGKGYLGYGAAVVADRSSLQGLSIVRVMASGAYHLPLGSKQQLHLGLQLGISYKGFGQGHTFPDQFDMNNGSFNGDLPTADDGISNSLFYFDMNAGVSWSADLPKFKPIIGVSFFHVTKPKESFLEGGDRLKMRPAITASGEWSVTKKFYITPNVLFMRHAAATDFIAGINLGFRLPKNKLNIADIYLGPYMREGFEASPNAIIAAGGVRLKQAEFGASYDIMTSDLVDPTNRRSAFEIFFIYRGISTPLEVVQVPCERL